MLSKREIVKKEKCPSVRCFISNQSIKKALEKVQSVLNEAASEQCGWCVGQFAEECMRQKTRWETAKERMMNAWTRGSKDGFQVVPAIIFTLNKCILGEDEMQASTRVSGFSDVSAC